MFTEIIKPTNEVHEIKIPKELMNQKLEVVLLPISSKLEYSKKTFNPLDYYGAASSTKEEIDSYLAEIKNEWE